MRPGASRRERAAGRARPPRRPPRAGDDPSRRDRPRAAPASGAGGASTERCSTASKKRFSAPKPSRRAAEESRGRSPVSDQESAASVAMSPFKDSTATRLPAWSWASREQRGRPSRASQPSTTRTRPKPTRRLSAGRGAARRSELKSPTWGTPVLRAPHSRHPTRLVRGRAATVKRTPGRGSALGGVLVDVGEVLDQHVLDAAARRGGRWCS